MYSVFRHYSQSVLERISQEGQHFVEAYDFVFKNTIYLQSHNLINMIH